MPSSTNQKLKLYWRIPERTLNFNPSYIATYQKRLVFKRRFKVQLNFKIDEVTFLFKSKHSVFQLQDEANGKILAQFQFDLGTFANRIQPYKPEYKAVSIKAS